MYMYMALHAHVFVNMYYAWCPHHHPWATWALTRDQSSIRWSCYSSPLKCGTWMLTQDTTVYMSMSINTYVPLPPSPPPPPPPPHTHSHTHSMRRPSPHTSVGSSTLSRTLSLSWRGARGIGSRWTNVDSSSWFEGLLVTGRNPLRSSIKTSCSPSPTSRTARPFFRY